MSRMWKKRAWLLKHQEECYYKQKLLVTKLLLLMTLWNILISLKKSSPHKHGKTLQPSLSPSPPLVWCVVVVVSALDKDKIVWQSSDLGLSEAVIRTLMMETGLGVAAITGLISTNSTLSRQPLSSICLCKDQQRIKLFRLSTCLFFLLVAI